MELYGSPTTKELKKKHSSRLVGGVEMGSWGREDSQQGGRGRTRVLQSSGWRMRAGSGWWSRWSHICVWINQEEQLGSGTHHATPGYSVGK